MRHQTRSRRTLQTVPRLCARGRLKRSSTFCLQQVRGPSACYHVPRQLMKVDTKASPVRPRCSTAGPGPGRPPEHLFQWWYTEAVAAMLVAGELPALKRVASARLARNRQRTLNFTDFEPDRSAGTNVCPSGNPSRSSNAIATLLPKQGAALTRRMWKTQAICLAPLARSFRRATVTVGRLAQELFSNHGKPAPRVSPCARVCKPRWSVRGLESVPESG